LRTGPGEGRGGSGLPRLELPRQRAPEDADALIWQAEASNVLNP
jgi:hypothetical protein